MGTLARSPFTSVHPPTPQCADLCLIRPTCRRYRHRVHHVDHTVISEPLTGQHVRHRVTPLPPNRKSVVAVVEERPTDRSGGSAAAHATSLPVPLERGRCLSNLSEQAGPRHVSSTVPDDTRAATSPAVVDVFCDELLGGATVGGDKRDQLSGERCGFHSAAQYNNSELKRCPKDNLYAALSNYPKSIL